MVFRYFLAATLLVGTIALVVWLFKAWTLRLQVRDRWSSLGQADAVVVDDRFGKRSWLGEWLFLAGYRRRSALPIFVVATFVFGLMGLGMAMWLQLSGTQALMERTVVLVPGGVGETFLPVVWVAPWLIAIIMVCMPWLIVRKARRERVERIEQDLPLALELFATLSEVGLGFDTALTRMLNSRLSGRPLANEFRTYQSDLLAGRSRVECLRRLSTRIRIGSMSIFVSAMVQAEQLGMGVARILRQQADDLRGRRRERAIAFVIMLDKAGLVVGIRRGVRPWRAVLCARGTTRIIETAVDATGFPVGTKLHVK